MIVPERVSSDGSAAAVGVIIDVVKGTVTIVVVGSEEDNIVSEATGSESVIAALETPAIVYVLVELKGKIGPDPEDEVEAESDEESGEVVEVVIVVPAAVIFASVVAAETVTILVLLTVTRTV